MKPKTPKSKLVIELGERSLREFLAQNLHLIEPGLVPLGSIAECQEYSCRIGTREKAAFIDILAVDIHGTLVVIETKIRATASALGQLAGYIAWARGHFGALGKRVRGIIVTLEYNELLIPAAKEIKRPSMRVYVYSETGMTRVA